MKTHILALRPEGLSHLTESWGEPRFRGQQVHDWLYNKRTLALDQWRNLPAKFLARLDEELDCALPKIVERQDSKDGSTKLLLASHSGHLMESVILRYDNRTSLCVSSQVGCKLACKFCQTGKLGFVRHLKAAEILAQFMVANAIVAPEDRKISHVVFMGMGEPLDNYEQSVEAVSRLVDKDAFGLSARHVTLSTSGIVPRIYDLAKDVNCALAISLHASNDLLRSDLMPINARYPLEELKAAMRHYQQETGKIITIEYILIRQKNCARVHAKELVHFLHGLRVKVNLIPFNPHPGLPYERPSAEEIRAFQSYLSERYIPSPVRYSKGLDISGACGQLAAKKWDDVSALPLRSNVVSKAVN